MCDIIEFSLFQNALLRKAVQYQFPMSQIIQYRRKISGISVDQVRSSFILNEMEKEKKTVMVR